ncbi:acyltransferase [Ancylobacter sp. 6x-1]|uniref:Acyltransferase n=1 Tax=Ancylobacter crimeensis TaxID=2579147 RepID=A0ABT0D780_9HYPH|nr:acyltransferase [Ancylobacter crimeensis]MCK0195794.1 acyltransferase [Ancylobacter crimeensis]
MTQHRYIALDGLRGIAALMVMIYHFSSRGRLFAEGFVTPFDSAYLAVDLFFVLSGFVIYHSYARALSTDLGVREYLLKRAIRLYPLFLAGLVIGTIASYMLGTTGLAAFSAKLATKELSYNLLGFPYANDTLIFDFEDGATLAGQIFPLNPPAWSLVFELIASFLFIFLYKLQSRSLMRVAIVSLVVLLALAGYFARISHQNGLVFGMGYNTGTFIGGFPRVIFSFVTGIILCRYISTPRTSSPQETVMWGKAWMLYGAASLLLLFPFDIDGIYALFFITIGGPALVWVGGHTIIRNTASQSIANFLGWLSYPVYCLHIPVGWMVWAIGHRNGLTPMEMLISATLATVLLSCAIATLLDSPVRRLLTSMAFHDRSTAAKGSVGSVQLTK